MYGRQREWIALMVCSCFLAGGAFGQSGDILEEVVSGIGRVTDIQSPHDGSGRLFLVQQPGIIRILRDGDLLPRPFLNIEGRVTSGGERGLLGLAFPPDFAARNYFYVNYTDASGATVVSRFVVSDDPATAEDGSERILLTVQQPFSNHNGGQIRFGPDGFLYIGMGDGGSANDPFNNAQNSMSLLGKMLRIDVEPNLEEYRIPRGNPFAGSPDIRSEIWALGLRNPWRFSFDRAAGDLWIGDVGQNTVEEIDFQPDSSSGGENYGWRVMEGFRCRAPNCDPDDFTLPVLEYTRGQGQSVSGGFVYRGSRYPHARGVYVYGDFVSGRIWGLRFRDGAVTGNELLANGGSVSTFGEDEAGELYAADYGGGRVFHLNLDGLSPQAPVTVDGASFAEGIVAGSAATVFLPGIRDDEGAVAAESLPLPTTLDGVQVLLDGEAAPLYSLANTQGMEQASFQAPFELAGRRSVSVTVRRSGFFEAQSDVRLFDARPGVFSTPGGEAIVIHHLSNRLVTQSEPLQSGEFAYLYATGLGPVENTPPTGAPGPVDPLAIVLTQPGVTIGGAPCRVLFAGLAPGFAGVYQINIQIPEAAPPGRQNLVVTMNGADSPGAPVWVE